MDQTRDNPAAPLGSLGASEAAMAVDSGADRPNTKQGAILRRERERQRLTQESLAAMAEVSVRTVIRAEQGKTVSAEALRALCSVLDLDVRSLPLPDPVADPVADEPCAAEPCAGVAVGAPAAPLGWLSAPSPEDHDRPLARLIDTIGYSTGRPEGGGGALGMMLVAWCGSALWHGVATRLDGVLCVLGLILMVTFGLDRLWRWAGLYGVGPLDRASLAFRATCYGLVASVTVIGGVLLA